MLLRLYNDNSPLVDNSKAGAQKSRTKEADTASPPPLEIVESDSSDVGVAANGVLKPEHNLNAEEATTVTAVLEPGVEEEKALRDEDRILASAQQKADDTKEIAPGVTDEEDVSNKTV